MNSLPSSKIRAPRGRADATQFVYVALVFAGPLMVTISSVSPNRTVATKSAADLIAEMKVESGPHPTSRPPTSPSAGAPTKI
jgi:hypothetical protein